jgi:hypothetical protein
MRYNYSQAMEYHTQRNNKVIPFSACNTTALVMAMVQAGWMVDGQGDQPEDMLTKLLLSDESYKAMQRTVPWSYRDGVPLYPPNEVMAMLVWAANKSAPRKIAAMRTISILGLIRGVMAHHGYVLLGKIPLPRQGKTLGHYVSVAGVDMDCDSDSVAMTKIKSIIIDDPYGDYRTEYDSHKGNDVDVPLDNLIQHYHHLGSTNKLAIEIAPRAEDRR